LITDKNAKVNMKQILPKSDELISMTPSEKQQLLEKVKAIRKNNALVHKRDPENVMELVKEGKINPCEMKTKKLEMIEANKQRALSNGRAFKKRKVENTAEDKKARAKSQERAAIKLAFSGMNELENNHFEDLLKHTMKQISEVNQEFQN
jgi:UPF0288 family protein (methanogenesis marker protein 3)